MGKILGTTTQDKKSPARHIVTSWASGAARAGDGCCQPGRKTAGPCFGSLHWFAPRKPERVVLYPLVIALTLGDSDAGDSGFH